MPKPKSKPVIDSDEIRWRAAWGIDLLLIILLFAVMWYIFTNASMAIIIGAMLVLFIILFTIKAIFPNNRIVNDIIFGVFAFFLILVILFELLFGSALITNDFRYFIIAVYVLMVKDVIMIFYKLKIRGQSLLDVMIHTNILAEISKYTFWMLFVISTLSVAFSDKYASIINTYGDVAKYTIIILFGVFYILGDAAKERANLYVVPKKDYE